MRGEERIENRETARRGGIDSEDSVVKRAPLGDREVVGEVVVQGDGFTGHQRGTGNHGSPCGTMRQQPTLTTQTIQQLRLGLGLLTSVLLMNGRCSALHSIDTRQIQECVRKEERVGCKSGRHGCVCVVCACVVCACRCANLLN